ncbi:MAG: efflux RND transporter periplasmic adaptor subunit [Tepidisphaeraceae bacterium]
MKWITASIIAVSLTAAAGFLALRYLRPGVDVTEVVQGPVVEAFYATGTVSAEHEYSIRSNVAGILHLSVDKGDNVKRGQVLAVVDNADLRFAVDQAKAELRRKEQLAADATSPVLLEIRSKLQATDEQLQIALDDEKRVTALMGHGATSQNDLDQSMNRVKSLWSDAEAYKSQIAARKLDLQRDLEVARAALSSAQWELDQATIRSPIEGTVLDWPVSDGTRIAVNDHVLQLADVSAGHLVMRAQVDEEDKNRLRPPTGADRQVVKMTLYAYPNEILTGTVDRIYDKADPDRRTYEVDVKFDRPDLRLAAGMTGELNFIVAQRQNATIVPTQAVQGSSVMVVRDGRLERPNILPGLKSVERTEIRSGLNLGDIVVISPILDLQPGQSVRTHWIDPAVAAGLNEPKTSADAFKGFR